MCWTTTSYPETRNTQSRLSVYNLVYLRSVSTCSAIVEWGLCLGERQVLQYDNTGVREDGILGDIEVRGYGTVRGLRDTGIREIHDHTKLDQNLRIWKSGGLREHGNTTIRVLRFLCIFVQFICVFVFMVLRVVVSLYLPIFPSPYSLLLSCLLPVRRTRFIPTAFSSK